MLLRRFVAAASRPFPWDHCSWRRIVSDDLRRELYSPGFLAENSEDPLQCYADVLNDVPEDATPLERQLHLDLRFHLPNDLLVKVDRMSMAHALEVRVPFLDQEVIAACLAMPPDCRRQGRRGKLPLRAMLAADFPADLVHRKKAGFLIPLESWLKGPWRALLHEHLTEEFAQATGLFQGRSLRRMIDQHARDRGDYSYALFSLLLLALWWETWIAQTAVPRCHPVAAAPTQIRRLSGDRAIR